MSFLLNVKYELMTNLILVLFIFSFNLLGASCDGEDEFVLSTINTPTLNQDGLGVCYAAAAATQLSLLGHSDISYLHAAIAYGNKFKTNSNLTDKSKDNLYFEGGRVCELFKVLKYTGYCNEYDVPLERLYKESIISSKEYSQIMSNIVSLARGLENNKINNEELETALSDLSNQLKQCEDKNQKALCDSFAIVRDYSKIVNDSPNKLLEAIMPKNLPSLAKFKIFKQLQYMNLDLKNNLESFKIDLDSQGNAKNIAPLQIKINNMMEKLDEQNKKLTEQVNTQIEGCHGDCEYEIEKLFPKDKVSWLSIFENYDHIYHDDVMKNFKNITFYDAKTQLSQGHKAFQEYRNIKGKKRKDEKLITLEESISKMEYTFHDLTNELSKKSDELISDNSRISIINGLGKKLTQTSVSDITSLILISKKYSPDLGSACKKLIHQYTHNVHSSTPDIFKQNIKNAFEKYLSIELGELYDELNPAQVDYLLNQFIQRAQNNEKLCANIKPILPKSCDPNISRGLNSLVGLSKELSPDLLEKFLASWDNSKSMQKIQNIIGPNCINIKNRTKIQDISSCTSTPINQDNHNQSINSIRTQLLKKRPVGLSVCSTRFGSNLSNNAEDVRTCDKKNNPDCCGNHAVTVLGTRCVKNRVQFLMKNSWGNDCSFYTPDKSKKEKCNPDTGDIWYDADNLIKISYGYQIYE